MVWIDLGTWDLHNPLHSDWNCHGNHKSTQQHLPHLPASLRRCLSRPASRQHGLRDLWLHLVSSRNKVLR
jgi:hypothetical protein